MYVTSLETCNAPIILLYGHLAQEGPIQCLVQILSFTNEQNEAHRGCHLPRITE